MGRFVRGAAALILGITLTSVAAAQTGGTPPPAASLVPPVTPHDQAGSAADRQRRDGERPADSRGRRLPRTPPVPGAQQEMARKEIMAHLIENVLIDQYLTAIKVTVDEKEVDSSSTS